MRCPPSLPPFPPPPWTLPFFAFWLAHFLRRNLYLVLIFYLFSFWVVLYLSFLVGPFYPPNKYRSFCVDWNTGTFVRKGERRWWRWHFRRPSNLVEGSSHPQNDAPHACRRPWKGPFSIWIMFSLVLYLSFLIDSLYPISSWSFLSYFYPSSTSHHAFLSLHAFYPFYFCIVF